MAPKVLYFRLCKKLIQLGFSKLEYAESVCILTKGYSERVIMAYLDDILLTSDSEYLVDDTRKALTVSFKVKDLGVLKEFLGVKWK